VPCTVNITPARAAAQPTFTGASLSTAVLCCKAVFCSWLWLCGHTEYGWSECLCSPAFVPGHDLELSRTNTRSTSHQLLHHSEGPFAWNSIFARVRGRRVPDFAHHGRQALASPRERHHRHTAHELPSHRLDRGLPFLNLLLCTLPLWSGPCACAD
jgi:hypothetical protein